ncbi:uncharacterized protein K460DRAFT_81747 [Cucurbitaria berberidis CBS 394.84]|uniref:F-box domain-containing protein n=1 Tax=Cucurbitaria berberidis CBS 394.84 TaxID=1168544 RepID=A0A9P4GPB8_9PLEO|nr:uncharacterized protein K460DRAFT_81747 [Cucurbitaria berberidis CBS 394.84]KAF1848862.1 hypothetical protein K460DRAFT_81747 [Cucurbitaria berberidis CBS 394.84]
MSESDPVACRPLPPELWAQICTHIDDFTLWVICRQVSPVLKAEAEREFVKTHLPNLRMKWHVKSWITFGEPFAELGFHGGEVEQKEFLGLSEDRQRVKFSAVIHCEGYSCNAQLKEDQERFYSNSKATMLKASRYSNLDFRFRFDEDIYASAADPIMAQTCRLGSYVNDLEIPSLEIDFHSGSFSFDWKAFLNDFYYDYYYVQRRLRDLSTSHEAPTLTYVERANNHLTKQFAGRTKLSLRSQDFGMNNFGSEEDALFLEAYVKRLKKSHQTVGKTLGYDDNSDVKIDRQTEEDIMSHIIVRRRAQNWAFFFEFMDRCGIEVDWLGPG